MNCRADQAAVGAIGGAYRLTLGALNTASGLAHLAQFGVLYQLLGLWLTAHGAASWSVGLIVSSLWPGLLVASVIAERVVHVMGAARTALLAGVGTAIVALLFMTLSPDAIGLWVLASGVLGALVSLRWVSLEGWLYSIVPDNQRGRVVAVHETIIHIGQALGTLLLGLVGTTSKEGFLLAAGVSALAVTPLIAAPVPMREPASPRDRSGAPMAIRMVFKRKQSRGIRIGLVGGVIDGMLYGMFGVYLSRAGSLSIPPTQLLTAFAVGGILIQWPLGALADRFGITFTTRWISVTGVVGVCLAVAGSPAALWCGAILLGALSGAVLTLATIAVTDEAHAGGVDMAEAVAQTSIAFTLGSCIGPALAGGLMDWIGVWAFPLATALACWRLFLAVSPNLGRPRTPEAGSGV